MQKWNRRLSDIIQKFSAAQFLADKQVFRQFYLDDWPTLAWKCGFEFSPESLYERATGNRVLGCIMMGLWKQQIHEPTSIIQSLTESSKADFLLLY